MRRLAWAAVVITAGLFITGIGTFFTHEADPNWYRYARGQGLRPPGQPSDGFAEWHAMFADAAGVLVLLGSAWFVYKISFRVVRFVSASLVLVLSAHASGSVIRFNVVKLEGKSFQEAARGYGQLFGTDLEYIVTARFELGAAASRIWLLAHVLTLPALVVGAYLTLRPVARRATLRAAAPPADPDSV